RSRDRPRPRALPLGRVAPRLPTGERELSRHVLGELDRLGRAVSHAEQRDRGAEAEEAHAVTAFAQDLFTLLGQWQAVDLDDVVEHPREDLEALAEFTPIEVSVIAERRDDELREVDRPEQARAIGRQRLLAA